MLCPICRKMVAEVTPQNTDKPSKWFPFCSERCQLVDLGRWLDGKYQIPVEITPEDDEPNRE